VKRLIIVLVVLLCAPLAVAEKKKIATASEPRVKAIWEPINYPADLELNDVFFVTDQEGWVTGGKNIHGGGVILHTTDGGDHWDAQVGDPESSDPPFHDLRFIDATHGWALQSSGVEERLLHTTDGTHWLAAGMIEQFADYQFTSDSDGVMAVRDALSITHDGGRTWSPAYACHAQVEVNGLMRDSRCEFERLQFVTPQIGYAIGHDSSAPDLVFVARTDDGGQSWNLTTSPVTGQTFDAFFIDERTGYIRTGKPEWGTAMLFKTADAGATWQGLAGSPGQKIAFADPEVGWGFYNTTVSFTHDGGGRWNSRDYKFPAAVNAFSLPRRDRGYVVGNHGMIYRYHVVPVEFAAKGVIDAPRLTPIDFSVPDQVQQLSAEAKSFQPLMTVPDGAVPATATVNTTDPPQAAAPPPIETTLNAVVAQAPAFVSRYRNLNLLMVGLQMVSGLPQQIADLKTSFGLVKTGADANARAAAAADFSTKLQGLVTFMNTNFHSPLLAKKKGIS
jgi:photosystem II stability/assembly factor-like uncharacterized protein